MKATGIVRRIDDLGRVVIPKEIRRRMGVQEGDALEIFVDNETGGLVLVPYFSEAPDKIRAIAENLSTMGGQPRRVGDCRRTQSNRKKIKKSSEKLLTNQLKYDIIIM